MTVKIKTSCSFTETEGRYDRESQWRSFWREGGRGVNTNGAMLAARE